MFKEGDRCKVNVKVVYAKWFTRNEPRGIKVLLEDEDGNKFKWYTSRDRKTGKEVYNLRKNNKKINLKMTIKEVGSYNEEGEMDKPHIVHYCRKGTG